MARPTPPLLAPLLLLLLSHLPNASGTVTVLSEQSSKSVASYPSRPANFGNDFEFGLEYGARVQLPPDGDLWLCGDADDSIELDGEELLEDADESEQERLFWEETVRVEIERRQMAEAAASSGREPAVGGFGKGIVVPPDMPVALLARRGRCTYEQKARRASNLTATYPHLPPHTVRYVLVYDNIDESKLITMASSTGQTGEVDGVDVALLFISLNSGQDLIGYIMDQSDDSRKHGGPRILLDGYSHWLPGDDGDLSFFGSLLLGLGCLLSCTCLFVSDRIGMDREQGVTVRRRAGPVLLTEEEVRTLPEIVFREDGEDKPVEGGESEEKGEKGEEGKESNEDGAGSTDKAAAAAPTAATRRNKRVGDADFEESLEKNDLTTPLLESSVSSLPNASPFDPSPLHENFDNTACSICLEEYRNGCRLRVLPCHHAFHSACIMPWLTRRSPTCPLCKAEFEGAGGDDESISSSDDDESNSSNEGGEYDEEEGAVEEEEAGTRVVARMLGIDLDAATGSRRRRPRHGPLMVRQVIPEVSDDEESSESSVSAVDHGFWRFMFGRRRPLQEEEVDMVEQQQVGDGGEDAESTAVTDEDERVVSDDAQAESTDNDNIAANEERSNPAEDSAPAAPIRRDEPTNQCLQDLEAGRRSEELREPLLTVEERSIT